jgi:hypothetical protein
MVPALANILAGASEAMKAAWGLLWPDNGEDLRLRNSYTLNFFHPEPSMPVFRKDSLPLQSVVPIVCSVVWYVIYSEETRPFGLYGSDHLRANGNYRMRNMHPLKEKIQLPRRYAPIELLQLDNPCTRIWNISNLAEDAFGEGETPYLE